MYERKSRVTSRQQGKLIEHCVLGATARAASEVVGVHVKTATACFMRLRQLMASHLSSYERSGEVEADERDFGGVRQGTRGRGAAGKVAVLGLLKRGGTVDTAIIPHATTETLLPIIAEKVMPDSVVYTEYVRSYHALDVSDFHHRRINHSNLFARGKNHINGIETCWNQAKRPLRKLNGIKQENVYWFLKECEWRVNRGNHQQLLKQLKYWYKHTKH